MENDSAIAALGALAQGTRLDVFRLLVRHEPSGLAAGEIALAEHPEWGRAGVRFDVLLVDDAGRVRRIADAFRIEG